MQANAPFYSTLLTLDATITACTQSSHCSISLSCPLLFRIKLSPLLEFPKAKVPNHQNETSLLPFLGLLPQLIKVAIILENTPPSLHRHICIFIREFTYRDLSKSSILKTSNGLGTDPGGTLLATHLQ